MIKATRPRKVFKKLFGQANHFVITSLVGLHQIETGKVLEAPEELRTSWSPKDCLQSARRSRRFILNSALSSAVDSVDVYLSLLWREPKWINGDEVERIYSVAKRSVYRKAIDLASYLGVPDIERAMIDVIITWRNTVIHELAENTVSDWSIQVLKTNQGEIARLYCGLDISKLAEKASLGSDFTFKEAASLIHATHRFVEMTDAKVIERLDFEKFTRAYFERRLDDDLKFRTDFFGVSDDRRVQFVTTILENEFGVSRTTEGLSTFIQKISSIRNSSNISRR